MTEKLIELAKTFYQRLGAFIHPLPAFLLPAFDRLAASIRGVARLCRQGIQQRMGTRREQLAGRPSDEHTVESALPCPSTSQRSATMHSTELVFLREHLILDRQNGTLSFVHAGEAMLDKMTASVSYLAAGQPLHLAIAGPEVAYHVRESEVCLSRHDDHLLLEWHVSIGEPLESWLKVRNIGQVPVQMEQLRVVEVNRELGGRIHLGAALRRWSVYQHGWGSWTPTFARHLGQSIHIIPEDERYARTHLPHGPWKPGTMSSEWVTVLWARGGLARRRGARGLLLGFVTAADQLAEIRLDADVKTFRSLAAICYADGITLEPQETLRSEHLVIQAGDNPLDLLESYAERLGESMHARPAKAIPTGWCTWYYFFGENGEKEVLENVAEMQRERLPLEYVLIDDGYQSAIGDWLTLQTEKYADMAKVAQAIHEAGRRAGIWIAPFGLAAHSATYQAHPEWVVRDENDNPVVAWQHFGQDIYALDLSHPEVEAWLTGVFRTMRESWGYDLFKIDFIFAACAAGRRYNPKMTRAQALRRGLDIIRSAIGEEAFLLGCGAPQAPCVGFVDGMRVGPDVAANWHPLYPDLSMPSVENALRNSIARYFTHGRLWISDPDCVLVRDRDDQSDLVLSEMRSLVGIVALLGGMTFSSDNLPSLRKGRFKYLAQVLPPTGISAKPLDLFENEMPQCLVLPVSRPWGEWVVVGMMNWQDRTLASELDLDALGLPPGRYHVFNYWPRRYMGVAEHIVTMDRHLPHELVVLLLKEVADQPDVLTTSFHVAQTLSEIQSVERVTHDDGSVTMTIALDRAGGQFGEIWFTYPPTLKVHSARVDGRTRKVSSDGVGIAHIGISPNGPAKVVVRFVPAGP